MPVRLVASVLLGLLAACPRNDTDTDTGDSGASRCDTTLPRGVELGRGVGGAFERFDDGDPVGLDIAPQGGFGVTAQVQTSGLAGGPAVVTVRTEIDGSPSGSFTFEDDDGNPTLQLFCRDDGLGTLGSGIAIGFDPQRWSQDNLTDLDGVTAELVVDITDREGATATGRATVRVVVGG